MKIISIDQVRERLDVERAYDYLKQGFTQLSMGRVILPPVGQLKTESGSLHIKYGMIEGQDLFVVKQATGFSENWKKQLPTGDGFMTAFCAHTGMVKALILDNGYLTDLRTALTVRYCAELYKPVSVKLVGILGTGTQALLSAEHQFKATGCRNIMLWGRTKSRVQRLKNMLHEKKFVVTVSDSAQSVFSHSDITITTTSSRKALLENEVIRDHKLIIAVGADEKGKQELSPELLNAGYRLIADHQTQCLDIGELQYYSGDRKSVVMLGANAEAPSDSVAQLTIADLTGTAVADIQITRALLSSAL